MSNARGVYPGFTAPVSRGYLSFSGLDPIPVISVEAVDAAANVTAEAQAAVDALAPDAVTAAAPAAVEAAAAGLDILTETAADGRYVRHGEQVVDLGRYVVGDGVADDTAAVQAAMDLAIAESKPLYCPRGVVCAVDPVYITAPITLTGVITLKARTLNQPVVLDIGAKVYAQDADVTVNAAQLALYGIRARSWGRSTFGTLEVQSARIWGMQFDPSGNNNMVQVRKFRATASGARHVTTATQTAATANVTTSITGYSTLTLATPVPAEYLTPLATYFVLVNGLAYKVRSLTATTVEVLMLDLGNGNAAEMTIIIGGGLNIAKFGDNGVGSWGALDIFSNAGIGIQQDSLYGHAFNNAVIQGNGIGFACADYTLETHFTKPYFELNLVDFVSWSYVAGMMSAPILNIGGIQNLVGRLGGSGRQDPKLIIFQDEQPSLRGPLEPSNNPGTRTLNPGQVYAYTRTGSADGTSPWTVTINNEAKYRALGAHTVMLHLVHPTATNGSTVTVNLAVAGETVEGGASGTVKVVGRGLIIASRVGTDWRVSAV
ncbi:hypothetical protein [Georgenia sp.]